MIVRILSVTINCNGLSLDNKCFNNKQSTIKAHKLKTNDRLTGIDIYKEFTGIRRRSQTRRNRQE